MSLPDLPQPGSIRLVRWRESELRSIAQFWHADPSEKHATDLHDAVELWQDALVAHDEARARGEEID